MKLLEVMVENLSGVPDGTYLLAGADGAPRELVVLVGDGSDLLQAIAAALEALRAPARASHVSWWAARRGGLEARLRARWALSEGEVARTGQPIRTAVSEWRFGPGDRLPRELRVEGVLAGRARADLARYVFLDANRISVWMDADPLAELLAGIARRDVIATRVWCRLGAGIVAARTPDTFAAVNRDVAAVFPGIRIERAEHGAADTPVACFHDGQRVELDQLGDAERSALHIAASLHGANMRGGLILVDRSQLPGSWAASDAWLDWLASISPTNQIIVTQPPSRRESRAG